VATAGLLWVAAAKTITLVVDGRPMAITTTSSNVYDLLLRQGLTGAPGVSVAPPPTTAIANGMTVVVSPAPGAQLWFAPAVGMGVWVMEGTDARSIGKATATFDEASASAPGVGTSPVVSVRVVVTGKVHDVLTNAGTTGELLSAMGIQPDADDRVAPSPSTPLLGGLTIQYVEVQTMTRVERVSIPFRTVSTFSADVAPGTTEVLRAGVPGERIVASRLTVVNGEILSRTEIAAWVSREPVAERLASGPAPSTGGTLVTPVGTHHETGDATWYDPPWSGLTAAHPWLPFGTRVTVTDLDSGRRVVVVINDRGPFGPGRIIDLSPEAFQRLAPLGRGVLHVRISW
jgi:uncharacterized protein YabE (DUF348 family)